MSHRQSHTRAELDRQLDHLYDQCELLQAQIDHLESDLSWCIDQLPCWQEQTDALSLSDVVYLSLPLPF